jgi:probable HAF family extracellular repeat protein
MNYARITCLTLLLASCSGASAQVRYVVRELAGPVGAASPFAINASGEVSGYAPDSGATFHATRWAAATSQAPAVAGYTQTIAMCIDASGRSVAQAYSLGALNTRSFLWDNASLLVLSDFAARSINSAGTVVGSAPVMSSGLSFTRACVFSNGSLQILPTLGGSSSQAMGISEAGVIVGSSYTLAGTESHACAWVGGVCRDLGALGGTSSQALAVNDSGGIVGTAAIASGVLHPVRIILDASGQVAQRIDLGVLTPGTSGTAMGVNSAGDVVGVSNWNACLWTTTGIHDLNTLISPAAQWRLDVASANNDHGMIVGWGMHVGQPRGFILSPKCVADFDDGSGLGVPDGGIGIEDLLFYLGVYNAGTVLADVDDGSGTGTLDGGVGIEDLLYFLVRYDAGC